MKEPISTVTNICYVIAGALVWHWLATPVLVLLGLASGWYHWTGWRTARTWDMRMVYAALVAPLVILLHAEILYIPLVAILWYMEPKLPSTYMTPGVFLIVALAVYIEGISMGFVWFFLAGGALNLIDLKIHASDILHAFWHALTATGLCLLYINVI